MKTWHIWVGGALLLATHAAQAQSSSVRTGATLSFGTSEADFTQLFDPAAPLIRRPQGDGSHGQLFSAGLLADPLTHTLRLRLDASSLQSFGGAAEYAYQFTAPLGAQALYTARLLVDGMISGLGRLGATRVEGFFGVRDLDTTEVVFDPATGAPSLNTDLATFRLSMAQDVFQDDDGTRLDRREGGWSLVSNRGNDLQRDILGDAFDTGFLDVAFSARPGSVVTVFGRLSVFAGAGSEGPIVVHADLSRTFSADLFDAQGQQLDLPGLRNFDGSVTAAVPEPQAWALWLAGLLAMGQALRRRPGSVVQLHAPVHGNIRPL